MARGSSQCGQWPPMRTRGMEVPHRSITLRNGACPVPPTDPADRHLNVLDAPTSQTQPQEPPPVITLHKPVAAHHDRCRAVPPPILTDVGQTALQPGRDCDEAVP